MTVDNVLLGAAGHLPAGAAIVVYDGDGFWPPYSAAEKLAMAGWSDPSRQDCEVSVIGDCVTPRRISHAISDGYRI